MEGSLKMLGIRMKKRWCIKNFEGINVINLINGVERVHGDVDVWKNIETVQELAHFGLW